jgi:cation transport regulator ChaC
MRFGDFNSADRSAFFDYVRNGLLHNGETRGDWRVRADSSRMLSKVGDTRIINRDLFHAAIVEEFQDYCAELASGPGECRQKFLRRMDAICGVSPPQSALYFAYGSNLSAAEIEQRAPSVQAEGIAFLPGFRLAFTKHSRTRGGDAADIEECATSIVWGYVYRVSPEQHAALVAREGGYEERSLTVWRVDGTPDCQDGTPVTATTFVGRATCGRSCGPTKAYLRLVLEGATARGLPASYVAFLAQTPTGAGPPRSRT